MPPISSAPQGSDARGGRNKETAFELPKNLAPLIHELVDLDGWTAGNALSLLLFNAATDQDGAKYTKSRALPGYGG